MIWYILYPFRGTTEPPRLSPTHPIRRAFQLHGTATAQHWLLSILLTVAISVLLCYPALFHPDSPAAAGLRNLPKHVWTSTTEVQGERAVDVEMRQVWVHGDYMKAIDLRVLRQALYVQDTLIGHGFSKNTSYSVDAPYMFAPDRIGCAPTPRNFAWGFHSPMMYWNCSMTALENDPDILATINSRSEQQSFLNFTLRPSTVFAGKAFANTKLRAADALVITLFDLTNSSLGETWEKRSKSLAQDISSQWSMYPEDGKVVRSRLYEFRFKPMTANDDLFLGLSYFAMVAYVIWRLRKLRAVKSKVGLLITIFAKMTVCVIASFTVCSFLGIDLARIPREFFPMVVLVFGLGNIFRLINEVLAIPPEMPPVQRIGNAIGEVGHLSLAMAGQNLILIYLCSRVVTPWVADFCAFAAATLVFDFVFHLTFFLAVLSVDVQRLELQDSLERVNLNQTSGNARPQPWLEALRQGTLPFSTRFAGSAAIVSLILALNWHFFDCDSRPFSLRRLLALARQEKNKSNSLWAPPPINQARTPADWLRIQDHNTAKELIGFVKMNSHSFIARVYDPILIVLNGADGRDATQKSESLLNFLRHLAHEHAFPAALIVVFLIAGITLLMNYLLWNGVPEDDEDGADDEILFCVKTLPNSQTLDIVRLTSCPKGHLVSTSLDRSTSIWMHSQGRTYANITLQTAGMKPKLWPIVASAVDDAGTLLALCTDTGQIAFWSFSSQRFLQISPIELRGQVPILFSFTSIHTGEHERLSIIIVTSDGYLIEVEARTGIHRTEHICLSSILSATLFTCAKGDASVVYASKTGEVHILVLREENHWTSEVAAGLDPGPPPDSKSSKIKCVYAVSSLGLIFALRSGEVDLINFQSRGLICTLQIGQAKPNSFRVMHSARRLCPCGAPAIHSLSLAYTEQDTSHMIMQTFTLDESPSSQICLGKPSENETPTSQNCRGLDHATESVHCVDPAGVWERTNVQSIIGIRKRPGTSTPSSSASGVDNSYFTSSPSTAGTALKSRAREGKTISLFASLDSALGRHAEPNSPGDSDNWEAWTLSSSGEFRSRPLISDIKEDDEVEPLALSDQLFVTSPGPITRLGNRSVAVGFGNTVKIITLGKDLFDGGCTRGEEGLEMGVGMYKWRMRRGTGRKMQ
ncbi:hypothetical protein K469DRAFT_691469 [Zopfia rhizophila CBS 207.26]|uniref:Sterol regulatory element-binding protein cleavage-activating protein n=1 Tax=Zopfia rhizophila CBS 207.26 TaxID=1314779 RepID=A0A6A6DV22_9PEZI|nr:hypothetical protein K469DRAFT_691469 [Zopfia rhizophila CBS 207.26]